MGLAAVRIFQALGLLTFLLGLTYLFRGANLPGVAGRVLGPRSEEWTRWMDAAPAAYWRRMGVVMCLFGVAILLIGWGCFQHPAFALGLVAFVAGLVVAYAARERFGPYPRRTRGSLVMFIVVYTAVFLTGQVVLRSSLMDVCR